MKAGEKKYYEKHKESVEEWKHGPPAKSWKDENGTFCIEYEDGTWWHYRMKNGEVEWW